MATYTVSSAKHATLVASTADTVTITPPSGVAVRGFIVVNRNGVAEITFDYAVNATPTTPTADADNMEVVPAAINATASITLAGPTTDPVKVLLVSAGATAYSVEAF